MENRQAIQARPTELSRQKLEISAGRLLLLIALFTIAGACLGWVADKPNARREGYQRALDDVRRELLQKADQSPRKDLRATPPRWRKV